MVNSFPLATVLSLGIERLESLKRFIEEAQHPTSNIKYQASGIEYQASSIEHPASSI